MIVTIFWKNRERFFLGNIGIFIEKNLKLFEKYSTFFGTNC